MQPKQPQSPSAQSSQSPSQPPRPSKQTEDADYAAASYSTANYAQHAQAPRPTTRHNWRWLLILLVVLIVGGSVYWFLTRPKSTTPKATTQTTAQQPQTSAALIDTKTTSYNSTEFPGLTVLYPSDWKPNETSGSGVLTITSPMMTLKAANSQNQAAAIVFKIRNKQQPMPEFDKGNAQAVLASQKIAYTSPSSSQRASTYVSFLQYATTSSATGLDGVYITGDTGYQAAQAIPKVDFTPVDPVISLTFVKCSSAPCSPTSTALTIAASDWNTSAFSQPLQKLLASLTIN